MLTKETLEEFNIESTKRAERHYKEQKEIAKHFKESVKFKEWLEKQTDDKEVLLITEYVIAHLGNGITAILPPIHYGKIKPWIEKYEHQKESV